MSNMKHFIIFIIISLLMGISWAGPESPCYIYGDDYVKVWDSGSIIPSRVRDVEVGDTDGDGYPEIIVVDQPANGGGKIYVFENVEDNFYALVWDSGTALTMRISRIAIGDQDNDGNLEIIAAEHDDIPPHNAVVHVFENTGDNEYQEVWNSGNAHEGMEYTALFLGDADSDGKGEIIIGAGYHWSNCKLRIYENTGDNTYQEVWNSGNTTTDSVTQGAVSDTDEDGNMEIIVGSGGIAKEVSIFENTGDNSFELVSIISGFGKSPQATVGDQDKDGKMEIIVGSQEEEWAVRIFEHTGSIGNNNYIEVWNSGTLDGRVGLPATGDQDHDGKREIVVPCLDANRVYLFENTGDNDFQEVWNSGNIIGGLVHMVTTGDQDSDGKGEIIAVSWDSKVYVFENPEPASITVKIDIKPKKYPNRINLRRRFIPVAILTTSKSVGEIVDFDATTVDPMSVYFGPDNAAAIPRKVRIKDVDNDGDLDILLRFKTRKTGIRYGDTQACLTGKTFAGQDIEGCDTIITVKNGEK